MPPCEWLLHILRSTEDPVTIVTFLVESIDFESYLQESVYGTRFTDSAAAFYIVRPAKANALSPYCVLVYVDSATDFTKVLLSCSGSTASDVAKPHSVRCNQAAAEFVWQPVPHV